MSSTNSSNNSTRGLVPEMVIKIRYTTNNVKKIGQIKLKTVITLQNAFDIYKKKKKIEDNENDLKENVFYLIKENEKIKLDKTQYITQLGINDGDLIEVSYEDKLNNSNVVTYNIKNSIFFSKLQSKQKIYIILFSLLGLIVIGLSLFLLYYFLIYKKKDKRTITPKKVYNSEELIIQNKRPYYPTNMMLFYESMKVMNVTLDSELERINDEKNST